MLSNEATRALRRRRGRSDPCDPSTRARRHQARQDAQARVVAVFHGGETDALDWRSDARLLAILDRAAQREQEAREKDPLSIR